MQLLRKKVGKTFREVIVPENQEDGEKFIDWKWKVDQLLGSYLVEIFSVT